MSNGPAVSAFLAQARSDFEVFQALLRADRDDVPECHPLHCLQTTSEKLAKAVFFQLDVSFDPFSHVAFTHIPYGLNRADFARRLRYDRPADFQRFLARASRHFRAIDEMNPAVDPRVSGGRKESENAEYPWRPDPEQNVWKVPVEYGFWLGRHLREKPEGIELMRFIANLLDRFDVVFR